MLLLISDANVLIDLEVGGIIERLFRLDATVAIPDVLYYEEIEGRRPHLVTLGLKLMTLQSEAILRVAEWSLRHRDPSRLDWMAFALAWQEKGILLTGDKKLRKAIDAECHQPDVAAVKVHGTIWLMEQMLIKGVITEAETRAAVERMKQGKCRLPWDSIEELLRRRHRKNPGPA